MKQSTNKQHTEIANMMSHNEIYKKIENGQDAWEGLTWILELLPFNPFNAVKALESYILAQPNIPDDRVIGLSQCVEIITAKFIHNENPLEKLNNLSPTEFEWLIEYLYENMG
ncbi:hypothetical protein [Heyndrickxia ginsengihumi]|uniref:hypothetical protein n=1 Tax=Heyndrickxia ginsengihumi TaxID=363870 RepID=UPI000472EC22|nr:hypothetical protein [Heyndrickxia ginsengihumi]